LFACTKIFTGLVDGVFDDQKMQEFTQAFDEDLSQRTFFNEDDRQIVRRIVLGYVVVRQLTDAVQQDSEIDVERLLSKCRDLDLLHVLTQAVDDSLDTLLHIAVRAGSVNIAKFLIRDGATPGQTNYRGDRPDQWLMWPRFNGAATECRRILSEPSTVHAYGPLLS